MFYLNASARAINIFKAKSSGANLNKHEFNMNQS